MRLKTLIAILACTITTNAGWKTLHEIEYYGPKAYTLKRGVAHVEVRRYSDITRETSSVSKHTKEVKTVIQMYRRELSLFGNKIREDFKRLPSKKSDAFKKGSYAGLGGYSSWYYNGFMLDMAHKMWRLENVEDVIEMVKPVDTPAEIRLVLWLHSKDFYKDYYSAKYRKSGRLYIVREHYVINDYDHGCGDYTYRYKINRLGKIIEKKLLSKKAVEECGGE